MILWHFTWCWIILKVKCVVISNANDTNVEIQAGISLSATGSPSEIEPNRSLHHIFMFAVVRAEHGIAKAVR